MDLTRRPPGVLAWLIMEAVASVAVWNVARATQSTLVVNTTDAGSDGMCDASHCSLPDAVTAANLNSGPDLIVFAIPPSDPGCDTAGVCTIRPQMPLEELHDDGITIDGFTQSGASPNTAAVGQAIDAVLKVVLDGSDVPGCCATGVLITGSGCHVRGLVIYNFYTGIEVRDAANNRIDGNFIGTDASGTVAAGNRCSGVSVSPSTRRRPDCARGDADGDGGIAINELVAAVNRALAGCEK